MKRLFPSVCFAAVFAVGLSAQTPTPTPQNPPTSPAPSSMAGQNTVTLTGCVKAGEQPNTFVLSDITTGADKATGTSGSTAAMPDLKGKQVRLIGAPASVDLGKHVGHTVSVSGMLAPQARGTTGAPSTTTPSTTEPANPSAARPSMDMDKAAPGFTVSSVSMVSASCSK